MAGYQKFRSLRIIEAKQVNHDFGVYDPHTSQRQQGRAGDYLVKDGNRDMVWPREQFERTHERVQPTPGDSA